MIFAKIICEPHTNETNNTTYNSRYTHSSNTIQTRGVREVSQSTLRKEKIVMKTMMMVTEEGETINNMKIMKAA